jgi:hypothetical protein
MMVCFDEHYVKFDTMVHDPATGDPLKRFIVYHEEGEEVARFVLPAAGEVTRWEIQYAAKDAVSAFRRRRRAPARLQLVA